MKRRQNIEICAPFEDSDKYSIDLNPSNDQFINI